jgi:hypothetical protein
MDTHSLAQHLSERPTVTHQIIVAFTGTDLIASKDAILKLLVASTRGPALVIHSFGKRHRNHSLLENFLHPVRRRPDLAETV